MKKRYLIMLSLFMGLYGSANAQCPGGRYVNEIFPTVTMDSVTYSVPYSLKMDIYQPSGDALAARPLIIMAHGGSFLSGTREDDVACDSVCARFARRGYVTASIDYRLSTLGAMFSTDSTQPINEVIQAVSDGKAAIRYFMQDASTTNTYRIDTNNIFIGGNSAGAVLYMHVGYLDSLGECPDYIQTSMAANGGFEGNSGNPGYTVRSKAIISLAGGLNETSFVGPGDKPSVNCQGDQDDVVPYTCADPNLGLVVHVQLCGLGSLEPVYNANSIYHMSLVFPGDGHVPWDSDPVKYERVDSIVTVFLYNLVCTNVAAVNSVYINTEVTLFPNPANELLNIRSAENLSDLSMCDETGRVVFQVNGINRDNFEINTSHFTRGLYFVRINFTDANHTPLVKRIVVE